MRVITEIDTSLVRAHLDRSHTGVHLPEFHGEYVSYRVQLEAGDLRDVVLWFQNEDFTENGSCLLPDLFDSVAERPRVASFIHGDPAKGYGPADLRTMPVLEPVMLTFDLESKFYYLIDGNNRIQAHYLSHRTIVDVPAYLCVHAAVRSWAYIPKFHKPLLNS